MGDNRWLILMWLAGSLIDELDEVVNDDMLEELEAILVEQQNAWPLESTCDPANLYPASGNA